MSRQRWPAVISERRAVIEARTAEGTGCTLVAVRHTEGELGLYFHGGLRCSAMLPPPLHTELIASLQRLAE